MFTWPVEGALFRSWPRNVAVEYFWSSEQSALLFVHLFVCVREQEWQKYTCVPIRVTFSRISVHWLMQSHGETWIEDVKQDTRSTAQKVANIANSPVLDPLPLLQLCVETRRQGDLRALFRCLTKTNRSSMNLNCSMMSLWPTVTGLNNNDFVRLVWTALYLIIYFYFPLPKF